MFRSVDTWIGKTLFIPIIIKICQMFNITALRYAALGNLVMYLIIVLSYALISMVSIIWFSILCVTGAHILWRVIHNVVEYEQSLISLKRWGYPTRTLLYVMIISAVILFIVKGMLPNYTALGVFYAFLLISIMFAIEIETIPPVEKKEVLKPAYNKEPR